MPGGEAGVLVTAAFELVNPLTDAELRSRYGLSAREVEVARLVASGLSNQEVAEKLGRQLLHRPQPRRARAGEARCREPVAGRGRAAQRGGLSR